MNVFINYAHIWHALRTDQIFFSAAFEKAIYKQPYIKCKTYYPPKSTSLSVMFKLMLITGKY